VNSFNTALVDCVKALGGSGKVGPKLYPEMTNEAAQRKLLDCLNPERTAVLNPEQTVFIMRMARDRGIHIAMDYLCEELSYSVPTPIEPADEIAELQLHFIEAQKSMIELVQRMEKLNGVQHFPTLRKAA
jgi:hypothetical protein